jgi:hypothetical protein
MKKAAFGVGLIEVLRSRFLMRLLPISLLRSSRCVSDLPA